MNKNFKFYGNRAGLLFKKHSPAILTGIGIVGTIVSIIMASKATLKLEETLDTSKQHMDDIKESKDTLTEKEYKKELANAYLKSSVAIGRLYLPTVAVATASISCLLGAQGILSGRNVALMAAYKAVEESYDQYRQRVIDELGKDKDVEFKYGLRKEKVTVEYTDEDGKKKKKKEEIAVVDEDVFHKYSQYARYFDELNPNWEKSAEYNLLFLRKAQDYANDLLRARGHVFLNEVYDILDVPRSKAGAVVGWVFDPDDTGRDNYVDIGIYNINLERSHAFVNGYEKAILLDFNVDGVIYDLI